MSIQNSLSPLVRSHRPLRTVLVGTSLGEESDQVVRAGLAVAIETQPAPAWHREPVPVQ